MVSGGDDAGVVVWDSANRTILCRFADLAAEVSSVDVCGHLVAAGTGVDDFKLMDVMLEGQSISDYQMECSRVYLWDTRSGREVTQLTGHREKVNSVQFVNGGTQVMSSSGGLLHGSEHSVFVWDVTRASLITNLGKQAAAVVGSCADSDGQAFFTLCWDGTVQAWDGRRSSIRAQFLTNKRFESSSSVRMVVVWLRLPGMTRRGFGMLNSGQHIATLDGHDASIRTAWSTRQPTDTDRSRSKVSQGADGLHGEVMGSRDRTVPWHSGRPHFSSTLAKFSMEGKFIVTGNPMSVRWLPDRTRFAFGITYVESKSPNLAGSPRVYDFSCIG